MPTSKALFNVNRLVSESGKGISPEMSFLQDFDYTLRQINAVQPCYVFQEITKESNPEYFDSKDKRVDIVCLDELPGVCDGTYLYSNLHVILHTNDQRYYVCVQSQIKPSKHYKPSSLHCIRQMYYVLTGADLDVETSKTSDFFGICESGEDRHLRIQAVISSMKKYGVDCEFVDVAKFVKQNNLDLEIVSQKKYETKLYDRKRNISFLCDGIIKYKGEYYIIEIKTESSFKWMKREGMDDSHRYQAYTYALEFGIDKVLFIYENRDVCTKKSYLLVVTDVAKEVIEERIKLCDSFVSQHKVPAVEKGITAKTCQYCSYRTVCKVDGEDEKTK